MLSHNYDIQKHNYQKPLVNAMYVHVFPITHPSEGCTHSDERFYHKNVKNNRKIHPESVVVWRFGGLLGGLICR